MDEDFEKFPGGGVEKELAVPVEQDFEKSFAEGVPEFAGMEFGEGNEAGIPEVPDRTVESIVEFKGVNEAGIPELGEAPRPGGAEFAGDKYGVANPENQYYGEAKDDEGEGDTDDAMAAGGDDVADAEDDGAEDEDYNQGVADAAALINYGLNAAARSLGVETVVQAVKGFNASGQGDPIKELYDMLGIDTPEERREMHAGDAAAKAAEAVFREGVNAPTQNKSVEGALKALADMKELIGEVEGADPRYEGLREGARAAGKGYFEYAVSQFGTQGLTELFSVLAAQRGPEAEK